MVHITEATIVIIFHNWLGHGRHSYSFPKPGSIIKYYALLDFRQEVNNDRMLYADMRCSFNAWAPGMGDNPASFTSDGLSISVREYWSSTKFV